MSISSEIQRINTNIANAYTQANAKGATLPQNQNSDNLATTISSISTQANLQSKTVTPTTSQQVIEPDTGYDGLSQVTVNAVEDISTELNTQDTILANQQSKILELNQALNNKIVPPVNLQSKTAIPTTSQQVITPDNNYDGLSQVTVNAIQTETKTVKSSSSNQTVTPTSGKFINEITVEALDLETKNITPTTSAQTITPTSGKDGISQINVSAVNSSIDNNIVAREY